MINDNFTIVMSFYSTLASALHRVQDGRASSSGVSDYALQTSADFGNLYWATVSLLAKSSLLDYVTHTREGDTCQFLFKHDSWFSDTDTDMAVSANVKLSLVEGEGVAVVAIFGLSGRPGFTDTIRGYVANGDLSNVIASWFKALSYDGKARSYYIDAWDDFSIALSNISEHPGFASAVEDSAASAEFSSAKEALFDMYDELTDRALRWYRIEFTDITRRQSFFTVDFNRSITIPTSKSRPVRNPHTFVLCDVCLRVDSADGKKLQATVTVGIQSISEEVSYKSEYAGSGYINTVRATLESQAQVNKFIESFLSLLGSLQADGYEYDYYADQVEKFADKVELKSAVSDTASTASSMKGLTPIESTFGGSALYRVLLWPGKGYYRDVFYVRADSEESALEALSTYLVKEGLTSYYYTEDEYADYLSQAGISEEEDTSYIYLDGTMEGAPYPIYLLSENLSIEKV